MAKVSKEEGTRPEGEKEPTFEEALGELESIVEAMEEDEMPLESLLQHFEKGNALREVCEKRLAAAELKVKKLEEDRDGSFTVEDFPPDED